MVADKFECPSPPERQRGEYRMPAVAKVPQGHWKTTTFVAALRHDRIEARARMNGGLTSNITSTTSRGSKTL
jgi:hypothetical protein